MKMRHMMTRDSRSAEEIQASIATRLKEIKDKGGLRREAEVGAIDVEARTVELSFSSELEYQRWFGIEVLSHDAGAVDLSRLNDGAALLWNHNWDDQRGVVVSASIDSDRKGRAVVKFSRSEAGEQMFQDIQDGIITKVSVGYMVKGMKLVEERDDTDVYMVTDWTPYEISMVSVPADPSVGVGRSAEMSQVETPAPSPENATVRIVSDQPAKGKQTMEKILRDASGNLVRAKVDDAGNIVQVLEVIERAGDAASAARTAGADAERARVRELMEMGRAYGVAEKAVKFAEEGKTAEDLRRELLADFAVERNKARPLADQVKEAELGLNDKEVRRFSLMKAVRALANPQNTQFQKDAAFEFECSRAAEKQYDKQSRGILIPADVLNRAFSTTTPSGGPGANVVAQNLMADQFIELLRNRTWALRRCTTMGGLVGNVDIPRQKGATQAYWVGEGGAPTEGEPALDQIHFSPKTLGAYTDITRRLMLQSTPDAELIVRNDILRVMALALDYAVLYGSGASNQPKGLLQQTGIHAVQLASTFASYAEYVQMETDIAAANADVESMSYIINARARGSAKTTLQFPSVNGSQRIWEAGNTINGYATDVTNQVQAGDNFFGNWADYIIAMWSGLDLMVDPYSLSTQGATRLIAFQDVDMNIRHTESFTYASASATPNP